MSSQLRFLMGIGLSFALLATVVATAQPKARNNEEKERKVKESDVPAAALAAIKKAAGSSKLTQIEEETENGQKFYEGQWAGPDGKIEALVTEGGALVEIEEFVTPDKVPPAVRASAEKEAGKGVQLSFEKKTSFTYEIHFQKDGRRREIEFEPTGIKSNEETKDSDHDEDD